jgi:hypothetical protein
MDRVLAAARLHFAHPAVMLGIPWLIVLASFALNAVLWGATPVADSGDAQTGGLSALYVTVLVVYVQAVTQLLPFGMGMGLSRRSFYLGTALAALVQGVGYGLVLTVLGLLERATDGFGFGPGARFWQPSPIAVDSPLLQFVVYTLPLLACAAVGAALGVLFKRWGPPALYALAVALVALVIGTLALIGWLDAWQQVGEWFADQSKLTFAVGVPLVLTVAAGALSFAGLRRVVP